MVAQQGALDVRVGELGEGLGGAARVEEAQAGGEVREAGRRRPGNCSDTAASASPARRPSRTAASRSAASAASAARRCEPPAREPPRGGRGEEEQETEAGDQEERAPYMGPRALGSPPARIRTSSS